MKNLLTALFAGLGAALAIGFLSLFETSTGELALLMAPFGATAVLVFGVPGSPLAQPKNVIVGHLLTALIGVLFANYLPINAITLAIATGAGVSGMLLTRTTHPPAGANPILIMLSGQSWWFLVTPVLVGTLVIVVIGRLLQRAKKRAEGWPVRSSVAE